MEDNGLHIDIVADDSSFSQTMQNLRENVRKTKEIIEQSGDSVEAFFKRIRDNEKVLEGLNVKIDLTNPTGELEKFDKQVLLMVENLNKYFDSLQGKLKDMSATLGNSQAIAGGIPTDNSNAQQLAELQRQNNELIEQLKQRQAELEKERTIYNQLAEAVRTNNVPALQQLAQMEDEASKRLNLDAARGSLKDITQDMDLLAQRMTKTAGDVEILEARIVDLKDLQAGNDPTVTDEVIAKEQKALDDKKAKLEEMKAEYNEMAALQKQYSEQVQQATGHHVRMRTQIMNAREEMMQMIAAGKRGTPEFQELAEHAGQMRRQMALANATMQYFADPNRNLTTLKVGLQGVAGAAGLVTGVMGVFNAENEKMAQIQTKVQSILSIIVGLQTTYNLVKKTSNIMLAIEEVKTWAVAKARGVQTAATVAATGAQEALNTAMRTNPIGAFISLLAILGTAIYAIVKAITSETEAEKKAREEAENLAKTYQTKYAESLGSTILKYKQMQAEYEALRTEHEKTQWITDNKNKIDEFGVAVKNVSDAERFFYEDTDNVVRAFMLRAQAAGLAAKAEQMSADAHRYDEGQEISPEDMNKFGFRSNGRGRQTVIKKAGTFSNHYYLTKFGAEEANKQVTNEIFKKVESMLEETVKLNAEANSAMGNLSNKVNQTVYEQLRQERENFVAQKRALSEADAAGKAGDDLQKKIDAIDKRLEVYSDKKKTTGGNANDTDKIEERQAKYLELIRKQKEQRERAAKDLELSTRQAEIDAMEDGTEKTIAQINLDFKKREIEITRAYEDLKQKKIEEAKKLWDANPANKGKAFDSSTVNTDYTESETKNYKKQLEANLEAFKKAKEDERKIQAKAMLDYLEEYGTIEQKRLAIAEEYAQKIAEAKTEGDKLRLAKEQEKAEANIEFAAIEQKIDWATVFDNLGLAMKGSLENMLDDLKEFVKSPKFQQLDVQQKQSVVSAMSNIRKSIGTTDDINFHDLAVAVDEYQQALQSQIEAQNDFNEAVAENGDALKEAKDKLKELTESDSKDEAALKDAQDEVNRLQAIINNAGVALNEANDNVKASGHNMATVAKDVTQPVSEITTFLQASGIPVLGELFGAFDQLKGGIDGLKALKDLEKLKDLGGKDVAEAGKDLAGNVSKVGDEVSDATKKSTDALAEGLGKAGLIAQIIAAILKILDVLKDGIGPLISGIIDTIFNAISGIIKNLLSGDFAVQIVTAIVKGIGNILNAITLGGFNSWFGFNNDNHEEMLELQEKYNNAIDSTTRALDKFTEQLEKSYGVMAIDNANKAQELIEKNLKTVVNGIDSVLSDNYGGGHSDYYHANKWQEGLAQIQKYGEKYGINVWEASQGKYTWQELLRNNAEDLAALFKEISEQDTELWRNITTEMGYNDGALKEWLDKLIDTYDQIEENDKQLKEQLTTTTADNVYDDFLSSLYDLADGSEDVMENIAENWQKMVNRMVVNNLIGVKMREQLEEWYELLYQLNRERSGYTDENGVKHNPISDDEYNKRLEELKSKYNGFVDDGKQAIDDFTEMGIIKPIEEATAEAASYFENLRDSWLSTLTDMGATSDDFKKQILDTMFEDLVNDVVLGAQLTVNTTKGEKTFKDFNDYLDDWKTRYKEIIEDATLSDEERIAALKRLADEQAGVRDEMAKTTEGIAESIGKSKEISNSLDNLSNTFLDNLLDMDADAKQMGMQIAQTLIREMLEQMLASEKYAGQIQTIKEKWQKVLNGENVDEDGNVLFTLETVLQDIADLNNAISNDDDISKLADQYKELGKAAEQADSAFSGLHDTFLNTLADIDADAKAFKKNLQQTLVKDLLNRFVLDVPINVTFGSADDPETIVFDNFDEYAKNWNERYMNIINADNLSQEEKERYLDELIDELVAQEEKLQEASDEIKQRIKERQEDTTFKDMSDSFVSALMDMNTSAEDWAETIGKTMAKKIIEQMVVANEIQPLLDDLQKAFDTAMSADGATYETAMNDKGVQAELDKIKEKYPELQALVKIIMESLGVNTDGVKEGFSDLRSSFVSALMDMKDDAESFGKSIGLTMAEQMLDSYLDKNYKKQLDELNGQWADALAAGDTAKVEEIKQAIIDLYAIIGKDDTVIQLTADIKKLENELDSTFKDMGDDWVSVLLGMDYTAADFGRQIGQTLVQKIVKEMIVSKELQTYLDAIQDAYNKALGKEGATWQSVLAAVTPAIDAAVAATEHWKPIIEEISKAFKELDNTTPLDNIRSMFLSQLMDMKSDTKDFAKSITEILTEAFIDKFVLGEEFNKRLEEWQKEYASIMGGNYSEEERANLLKQLRQAITAARDGYAEEAKIIHDFMGTANYDDQQATMNMADKITYEQADMLLGINMAQELTLEQILATLQGGSISVTGGNVMSGSEVFQQMYGNNRNDDTVRQILETLRSMSSITAVGGSDSYGEQIFNRLGTTNDYLLAIRDEVRMHLGNIAMYTSNLVKL